MLAALLLLLLKRQRQHWQQAQPAKQLQSRSSWSFGAPRPPPDSSCDDIEPGGSFQAAADGSITGSQPNKSTPWSFTAAYNAIANRSDAPARPLQPPLISQCSSGACGRSGSGGGGSKQLLTCPRAAQDDQAAAGEAELHFGALLGAGAFGRVYKARWGDKDVAVKVIEHEPKMAPVVENEVQLMMSCSHENVVRAYHYITQTPKPQPCSSSTAVAAAASSSRTPCSNQGSGAHSGPLLQRGSSGGGSGSGLPGHLPPPAAAVAPWARKASGGSSEVRPTLLPPAGSLASTTAVQQLLPLDQPGRPAAALTATASGGSSAPEQHCLHRTSGGAGSGGSGVCWSQSAGAASTGLAPGGSGGAASMLSQGFWPQGPVVAAGEGLADMSHDWEASLAKTFLIQEYCDAGTLSKTSSAWLPANEGDSQMLRRLVLLRDVAAGLAYLHSRSIVHGDLNARNVLITSNPAVTYGYTAKLADLGLSRTIKHQATHHTTCTVGTLSHMPAELLRLGRMSPAVDVYSLGIMMWGLFTRKTAFKELHYGQFFDTVVLRDLRPPPPPNMPEDYRLLMERCWSKDPALRPSASTVLQCIDLMISDRQSSLGLLLGAAAKAPIPQATGSAVPAAASAAGDAAFVMSTHSCVCAAACTTSGSDSSKIAAVDTPGLLSSAGSPRCRTLPEQQQQQQRWEPPHRPVRGPDDAVASSEQESTDTTRQPGTPCKDAQQQQQLSGRLAGSRWIEDL